MNTRLWICLIAALVAAIAAFDLAFAGNYSGSLWALGAGIMVVLHMRTINNTLNLEAEIERAAALKKSLKRDIDTEAARILRLQHLIDDLRLANSQYVTQIHALRSANTRLQTANLSLITKLDNLQKADREQKATGS